MSSVNDIAPSTYLSDSLALLMGNFFAIMGNSAGTAFPTVNLRESMFFFHTSQKKVYVLARVTPAAEWKELLDLNLLLSSGTNRVAYFDEVAQALGGKQNTIDGAASTILASNLAQSFALASDAAGKVIATDVPSSKLQHIKNLTSDAQAQLNNKQKKIVISTVPPSAGDGVNGDVWMVIE